jgi:pyrimidine-specific ribonucleoside hydrolase
MKKILTVALLTLLTLVVLIMAAGPLLQAMGVDVLCVTQEEGRWRLVRCGGAAPLTADTGPPALSTDARPIVIDTDMAADDWMAILFLLQRPDLDVRAVTVTGAGEAHCEPGVQNALDLVALAGRPDIPVTCGRETPLQGNHVFPPSWRDHVDALAGVSIPSSPGQPHEQDAVALIASAIREAAGELEIIALGPLTNLGEAFQIDPSLAEEIAQIYVMGGAFNVPGNVTDAPEMAIDNQVAEWNIYVDPYAAALVVASGAPITFVPLDASNHVPLDERFYDRLDANRTTPEAMFVYQMLTESIGFVRSGDYYFWDPLTAAILVDESLSTLEAERIAVTVEEGPESGATRPDPDGTQVRIATWADEARFKALFLDVLNGRVSD